MSENKHLPFERNSPVLPPSYRFLRQQRSVSRNFRTTVNHIISPPPRVWPQVRPVLPFYPPDGFYPPLMVPYPLIPVPVLIPQPAPCLNLSQVCYRNESWEYNCNIYSDGNLASPWYEESIQATVKRRPIKIEKPPELEESKNVDVDSSAQHSGGTVNETLNTELAKIEPIQNTEAKHDEKHKKQKRKKQVKMPSNEKNNKKSVPEKPDTGHEASNKPISVCTEAKSSTEYRFIPTQTKIKRKILHESSTCKTSSSSSSLGVGSTTSSEKDLNVSIESRISETMSPSTPNTSAYFSSLDSTSSSFSTPDVITRKSVKRSYIDLSDNDQNPNNSFQSRSSYHTPDQSPKNKRPRWSEHSTPIRRDSGSFSMNSPRSFSAGKYSQQRLDDGSVILPQFIGYQLLGDSQFCRFGQQLLGLQRVPCPNSPGRIGICVSGQTINDLHERIKEKFYPLSDKVILMIGTNDFLRNQRADVTEMCHKLAALVKTLQETVTQIVLLTLPPIPKLERQFKAHHFAMLNKYNSFIRSLASGDKLRVGDISPMYMTDFPYQKCRMNLFELYFSNSQRPDMIHLNRHGLEVIKKCGIVILRLKIFVTVVLFKSEEQLVKEVDKEVRDYAVKIGINPDTEKHLLNIALDGLMTPLPSDWKACLDERSNHIFYFNSKLQRTQWNHPLDQHFENLVKQKRLTDESISAGDDDSKTSIKEDLKSFEEAATTSDMISSRHPLDSHKSRLSTGTSKTTLQPVKDASPEGRKVLNPLGRPPLPPKRRPGSGSVSPKRGGSLSLRLGSTPGTPARIDIDSLGLPLGLPSPETKSEKLPPAPRPSHGIKLTGGGSAFLKSNQKQTPSPSEESKPTLDDPLFEIVREAESLDSPEDENKSNEETKLKHSVSLGESGFDRLTKSKRFASLQESLLSLKREMDDARSPNTSTPTGLRGILREKPSSTTKLWDMDPALLTNEEKERLRVQEMKEERKQNVRFADIINKPIKIHFSKSDSEDDSNINDSSNDLDDLILEQVYSDEELKKDSKDLDDSLRADDDENEEEGNQAKSSKANDNSLNRKESNKIILSRLTDLEVETRKLDDKDDRKSRTMEIFNNNKDDSEDWLTGKQNVINQNEQKVHKLRAKIFDNSSLLFDAENNAIDSDKNISAGFTQSLARKDNLRTSSPMKQTLCLEGLEELGSFKKPSLSPRLGSAKSVFLRGDSGEDSKTSSPGEFHKSKLMPEMNLQKVFDSVRESIKLSTDAEIGEVGDEEEPMQTSPPGADDVETAVRTTEERQDRRVRRIEEHQRRQLEERRAALQHQFEENIEEIREELKRQESIERQRLYMEVQQSVSKYRELIEKEKNERESQLRNDCEDFIKKLDDMLTKEKEEQVERLKEDHKKYLEEHKSKISEEKEQFELESQMRLQTSSSQLEKIMLEFKQKEEVEVSRLMEEKKKRLDEIRSKIEIEQAEKEKKHREELSIVEAEYARVLVDKRSEVEKIQLERQVEIAALRSQQEDAVTQIMEQHRQTVKKLQDQCHMEEEYLRRKHAEKMDALNLQLNKASEKEDFTQVNREFEKVRCEKRLLEDKYKSLKEKYLRLKNEVRLSMERKRQAKMNRQLQQRDPSTTEDTTDRSTDHSKPPLTRRKLGTNLSPETEAGGDNTNGTQKTIKRRPKLSPSLTTSSAAGESSSANVNVSVSVPPAKPKNVRNPSPQQRREGASSAEDNHTSVSEEIQMEEDCVPKWTQSALTPLENLRKQLEKLDDLEEQFPNSVHADTYLRYPFSGPANGSCELDFYRHRLHLERESVKRAKQAVAEQRLNIEHRQVQLRHRQHTETLHQLHQEERELTDMEVNLHRTRALLGEKIIRLRHLEHSIERAAVYAPTHTHAHSSDTTNTDSSGFSGSDLDLSTVGQNQTGRSEMYWTENVLHSLENINGEIREIWSILGKQQTPGLGPPPMLNYESRGISQGTMDIHHFAPHRATDIADRTRKLKEWLIRTRDQQTRVIAPVNL